MEEEERGREKGQERVKYTVGARGRGSTKGKCRVGAQNTI